MFKTGELSKVFDIDRTSLNYYVKTGLLTPEVQDNQYHHYSFVDMLALSYIRYYRGLGFGMNQIKKLIQENGHSEKIEMFDERLDEISNEILLLQMKKRFLEFVKGIVHYFNHHSKQPAITVTKGYYFIRKEDLEDPFLKELYKLIPSSEFEMSFDEEYNIYIKSVKSSQGLILKEEWVEEFQIRVPEKAIYYPPLQMCICSWRIDAENADEQVKEALAKVEAFAKEKGYQISRNFVGYVLISKYHTEQMFLDGYAQFHLSSL